MRIVRRELNTLCALLKAASPGLGRKAHIVIHVYLIHHCHQRKYPDLKVYVLSVECFFFLLHLSVFSCRDLTYAGATPFHNEDAWPLR